MIFPFCSDIYNTLLWITRRARAVISIPDHLTSIGCRICNKILDISTSCSRALWLWHVTLRARAQKYFFPNFRKYNLLQLFPRALSLVTLAARALKQLFLNFWWHEFYNYSRALSYYLRARFIIFLYFSVSLTFTSILRFDHSARALCSVRAARKNYFSQILAFIIVRTVSRLLCFQLAFTWLLIASRYQELLINCCINPKISITNSVTVDKILCWSLGY